MAKKKQKRIKVTQIRSSIGRKPDQRKTLIALGLGRIGKTREFTDTPQIRGMIDKVKHLVSWEEVK